MIKEAGSFWSSESLRTWAMSAGRSSWNSSRRIQDMFLRSKRSSGSFDASKRPRQHVPSAFGVGIVDGRCPAVYWFEGPFASGISLGMLKTVMWPSVRVHIGSQERAPVPAGRRAGARHTRSHGLPLVEVRRPTALREDPALYSPDMSCLDFSFWPQASQEVAERMPETLDELKTIVEGFAHRMDGDQLRRMARHTRRRAELCCAEGEGASSTSCGRTKCHSWLSFVLCQMSSIS